MASNRSDFTSQTNIFTSCSYTHLFHEKGQEGGQTLFLLDVVIFVGFPKKLSLKKTFKPLKLLLIANDTANDTS